MKEPLQLTQLDIEHHLQAQGLDATLSQKLAEILWNHVLSWRVNRKVQPNDADYIFAFAFGFRWNPKQYGAREPGQVNQKLAKRVQRYYQQKPRPIYAQWEISSLLVNAVGKEHLHPIYPEVDESGREQYLSTNGVLKKIRTLLKPQEPKTIGPVLIVAHRNHLPRCVWLAANMNFTVAAEQANMPVDDFPESAQRWITSPVRGIVSEIISRLAEYRREVLYEDDSDGLQ